MCLCLGRRYRSQRDWAPHAHGSPPSLRRHDVVEVAGLTSFSFGEDDDSRYVMIFKKVKGLGSVPPLSQPLPLKEGEGELTRIFGHSACPLIPRSLHPQMKS